MAVCVPEIAGHDAASKFFVILFVCEPRLFARIGEKTALDDDGGAGEDPHEVDGAFSLLCLSAVFRVAAGDERRLERLGERLSECAVRGVKHLCAVVLRIAEFVEMNADKNRRGDALDVYKRQILRMRGSADDMKIGLCGDLKYGRTVHSLLHFLVAGHHVDRVLEDVYQRQCL